MIERYRNHELNRIFENLFVNGAVYFLLQKYDMCPEKEDEAKLELTSMIREFCETYKGKKVEEYI